jgi:glycosyltransferase involved in cell wall biosynthesis
LITINAAEHAYVEERLPDKPLFYAPMGIDLEQWPYSWRPAEPPWVAYYGGLGSPHNRRDALRCYEEIMPRVWEQRPEVELWLVGSNPPPEMRTLDEEDARVHVTGYVEEVQEVLRTMTAVLCPWRGRYGFRSRLIEVMALGVPVVASPDAVYGMNLPDGEGLLLGKTDRDLADHLLALLTDESHAGAQSQQARRRVEEMYSFITTYERLANDLFRWLQPCKNEIDRLLL